MPRGTGNNPNIQNQGTNSQGNDYTAYNNGAYRYHNNPSNEGQKSSNFYDTGNGHSFYRQNGSGGYQYHENSNQGFRDYRPNGNKK